MTVRLVLPLPPSANAKTRTAHAHPMALVREKNRYKEQCWIEAYRQAMPRAVEELPARSRITATFYVHNTRDEDKLGAGLEWVLDALKALQPDGDPLRWKNNIATRKGYFRDDSPRHIDLDVSQVVDRKCKRLELTIEPAAESQEAA